MFSSIKEVKDFNEIIKYFENRILTEFNKEIKSIKDFKISCTSTNIDYLLSLDIDRSFKLKQLKTMYINEEDINIVREHLLRDDINYILYEFNQVGGKENSTHHKKGGCIKRIEITKEDPFTINSTIYFRASVAPYNLYYDLIMLNELFARFGFKESYPPSYRYTYIFHFDEIKGKLMQNFFYYISAGYYDDPIKFNLYDYGKMMVEEYKKAEFASYHSTKRFWGKCNDAMERRIR